MQITQVDTDFFLIEKIFNQLSSSVAIALMRKDKLIYEFYGGKKFSSTSNADHINRSTRFNIGTASMVITGALIVKLMEFGEIRLNDSVQRFIPNFKFEDITVFHLLTHTSGLSFNSFELPENYIEKKEFYKKVYDVSNRTYETGKSYAPFTYGYAILSDIAERIMGQTIDELASALIFMPLGMNHTTYGSSSLREDQFVIPWNHKENRFLYELHKKLSTGFCGIYSTVLDMIRFGRMFLNEGIFDNRQIFLESSIDFMLREITGNRFMRTPIFMIKGNADRYGCFAKSHSASAVAQTGDTGSILFIDPTYKTVGVALANSTWVNDASTNYSNVCDILMSI